MSMDTEHAADTSQVVVRNILFAFLFGIIAYFAATMVCSDVQARFLGVLVLLVTLWTNEGLPLGVASLLPIVLFPALGILDTDATAANYAQSIIFLFIGGFLLAIATEKIGLHKIIAQKVLRVFPTTRSGVIFSLATTSALLSAVLSNTTTALLLMPVALFLTENTILRARFALAVAFGSSIGGILTPIGTPPNLVLLGFLKGQGLVGIPFITWIVMMLPVVVCMLAVLGLILSLGLRNVPLHYQETDQEPLLPSHTRLLYVIGGLIALLFLNSPIGSWYGLGLDEKSLFLAVGLLLFLPTFGPLTWQDTKKLPLDVIFLFGAGFAIAQAFGAIGFSEVLSASLGSFATLPFVLSIGILALLITLATSVTSNTALTAIALPIVYTLATTMRVEQPIILLTITAVSASFAFILPISTPPNAIALASGAVATKTMVVFGVLLCLAGTLAVVGAATFFWPSLL